MAEGKSKIWKRLVRLVRGPTFGDYLEDSAEEIRRNPVQMNCPVCGEMAPLAESCLS